MKLRFFVFALILASMTIGARAQGGLYLNPIVTRISEPADTGPFAFLGQNQTSQIFGGIVIGGYQDVFKTPKYEVGLDLRDEIQHGNDASLNSFLFGVRVAGRPASKFKPYGQLSIGEGRSHSPLSPIKATKLEWTIAAGIDRPLSKVIDWRVIEVGYGRVTTVGSYLYVPSTIPQAQLINFSTGFVFRIP